MWHIVKYVFLFSFGGAAYYTIELLFRQYSHPSMFVLGGLCFVICGSINAVLKDEISLIAQMFLSTLIITTLELVFGYYLNIKMHMHIWDYSDHLIHFKGQICLLFSVIWFFLSALIVVADDYIRYWFFGEKRPVYIFFGKRKEKI